MSPTSCQTAPPRVRAKEYTAFSACGSIAWVRRGVASRQADRPTTQSSIVLYNSLHAKMHSSISPNCSKAHPVNKDQVKGRLEEAKGKVKEVAGKVVGNKRLEAQGDVEQVAGKVQKTYGDMKEQAKKTR